MTEESDADTDNGEVPEKIVTHRLVWRSECK